MNHAAPVSCVAGVGSDPLATRGRLSGAAPFRAPAPAVLVSGLPRVIPDLFTPTQKVSSLQRGCDAAPPSTTPPRTRKGPSAAWPDTEPLEPQRRRRPERRRQTPLASAERTRVISVAQPFPSAECVIQPRILGIRPTCEDLHLIGSAGSCRKSHKARRLQRRFARREPTTLPRWWSR